MHEVQKCPLPLIDWGSEVNIFSPSQFSFQVIKLCLQTVLQSDLYEKSC